MSRLKRLIEALRNISEGEKQARNDIFKSQVEGFKLLMKAGFIRKGKYDIQPHDESLN